MTKNKDFKEKFESHYFRTEISDFDEEIMEDIDSGKISRFYLADEVDNKLEQLKKENLKKDILINALKSKRVLKIEQDLIKEINPELFEKLEIITKENQSLKARVKEAIAEMVEYRQGLVEGPKDEFLKGSINGQAICIDTIKSKFKEELKEE